MGKVGDTIRDRLSTEPKTDLMTALKSETARFVFLLLITVTAGCGSESTQDKFMRIARERAQMRADERAEEAKEEAKAAESTVASVEPKPEVDPIENQPVANQPVENQAVENFTQSSAANAADISMVSAKRQTSSVVATIQPVDVDDDGNPRRPRTNPDGSPISRDQTLKFSPRGQHVAVVGQNQVIGVYDVASKTLTRQVFNPALRPTRIAISENAKLLAAGGFDGGMKVFPIESIDGLDRFQQNRLFREDATPPRKTHDGPLTAIAVNDSVGIVATGGTDGVIKLWSTGDATSMTLSGNGNQCGGLIVSDDDQSLYAANENGVSSWQVGKQQTEAATISKKSFAKPPTTMIAGPDGKGFVVGDGSGRVTVWTSENDKLVESSFAADSAAIDSLGYANDDGSLITVARSGVIAKWKLPIPSPRSFDVVESPRFVVVSPDGNFIGMPSRDSNFDLYRIADGKAVRRHSIGKGSLTAAEFSGDGKSVALADSTGRVFFQDQNRRPIAYQQLASSKIDRLRRTPDGKHFVFTTESGTVGVAAFPHLESASTTGGNSNAVASNQAGTMADGFRFTVEADSLRIVDDAGKPVGEMPVAGLSPVAVALHQKSSSIAVCDQSGAMVIRVGAGPSVNRVALPMPKPISVVWSADGSSVAATDGNRIAIVDVKSATVQSQMVIASKATSLVGWTDDKIRFVNASSQAENLTPPHVRWKDVAGDTIGDAMCSGDGRSVFVGTLGGTLIQFDVATGDVANRTVTGRSKLRSLVSIGNEKQIACLAGTDEVVILENGVVQKQLKSSAAGVLRSLSTSKDASRLYGVNDGGQILAWNLDGPDETSEFIPCAVAVKAVVATESDQLIVAASDRPVIAMVSSSKPIDVIGQAGDDVADSAISPDGQFVAVCNRSENVRLISLSGGNDRELNSDEHAVAALAIHPEATRVAAIGSSRNDDEMALLIWEVADTKTKPVVTSTLPPDASSLTYSHDGGLIAIGFADGHVEVVDASTAKRLESLPPVDGLQQIAFAKDNSRLMMSKSDGQVRIEAFTAVGETIASDSAIATLTFHNDGKFLLCGSDDGQMTCWDRDDFQSPYATFQGIDAAIVHSSVSSDGRFALSVYDDFNSSTLVWDLNALAKSQTPVEPRLVIQSEVPVTSAAFTADSKFVLVGRNDGTTQAWNVKQNQPVAAFRGHSGPVVDLAATSKAGRFVSGGWDQNVKSWEFPSNLARAGQQIAQGIVSDTFRMEELLPPEPGRNVRAEDALDAARQALLSGATSGDILDLMSGSDQVKNEVEQAWSRVIAMEKNGPVDKAALSRERRRLATNRLGFDASEQAASRSSFAAGFANLTFVGQTNFKFGLDRQYRPVRLLFADRFLYAARPSAANPKRRPVNDDDDGRGPAAFLDEGDNGALLSWDFKFSGLQTHAWSTEDLHADELFPLRDSGGVFTVPQMTLFNQDGSSRPFGSVASWAISHGSPSERQYLAVGTAGGQRSEDDILKVFDISDFNSETTSPHSRYRSFEGVVTAMAFANQSSTLAFCVRERAVHRLFIADAETLRVQKLEEHNHDQPYWDLADDQSIARRNSGAAAGVTSLAFSPDDRTLLAHGQYEASLYKLSTWDLAWQPSGKLESFQKNRRELTNDAGPFFIESGYPAMRFVAKPNETSNFRRILVRTNSGFSLVNIASENAEQKIDFLNTHHGTPEHAISDDGRWIVMGDDNGMAYIWDTIKGDRYSLTMTNELEQRLTETKSRIRDIRERPAHSGPIVGVALSDADAGCDYPAFVATIGEENKIKVWEMFPLLDPEVGNFERLRN